MHTNFLKALITGFLLFWFHYSSWAAYLGRPELVDYNFINATICTQNSIKIKFDYQSFNAGNVFTVEISNATGSFANPVTMGGTLAMSGGQSNVFFTVTFPAGQTFAPGNGYRLRVKGTTPLTYSQQVNEYPFSVTTKGVSDLDYYPLNYWRGYFYTWNPSTSANIPNAAGEDIFNPANYVGYICEDSLSFDYNWGNNTMAPGIFADSNKVCGNFIDKFSLRMRRRINFEEGYYIFGGGADDGFRLSLDGGVTWLINDWGDHPYRGSMQNNGCGVLMTAGVRDVVCDFYDHTIDARFRCIIMKTGDPAINPISITNPANGTNICTGAFPFQMVANPPGAWQWSGTGVSSNGSFNPAIGGTGPRIITYQTGYSAFGQNCVKTTSVTVNVSPGLSAQFSGLLPSYCINGGQTALVPQNSGGVFSGTGLIGNAFSPQTAGIGTHTIRYITGGTGGCVDTVDKTTIVYDLPDATFANLPDSICVGTPDISLVPNVPGGSFIGQGVIPPNQFSPAILLPSNQYQIEYRITKNGCSNQSTQFIYILEKLKPTVSFPALKSRYCTSDQPFQPVSSPAGRYFLNGTEVLEINPAGLPAGNYELKAMYRPASDLECIDSASAKFLFTIISNPKPDLGQDRDFESGMEVTLDPKIPSPYLWTADATGYTFAPDKVLTFKPTGNVIITVNASDSTRTCFGSDQIALTIRPVLEIPNLFTPNGDAFNQEWRIKNAWPNMRVTIFDRWGKVVYKGNIEGEIAWKGEEVTGGGTFFYLLENPADGRTMTGWVTKAGI